MVDLQDQEPFLWGMDPEPCFSSIPLAEAPLRAHTVFHAARLGSLQPCLTTPPMTQSQPCGFQLGAMPALELSV